MYRKWNNYLDVVVDSLSKMCILILCKKKIMAEMEAHLFCQNVWVDFGIPTSIISDSDSRVIGKFGHLYGSLWKQRWIKAQHFIHKSTVKQKWSIEMWYTFFEGIVVSILNFGMNSCIMYNMPRTKLYTLLLRSVHSRHVLGTCQILL